VKTFSYVALEARGKQIHSDLTAGDLQEALRRIRDLGLFPIKVKERRAAAPAAAGVRVRLRPPRIRSIRPKALLSVTRQLATLVQAGLPLLRGLRLLEEQETGRNLRVVLRGLAEAVENGSTFSEALGQYPGVFNRMYVNLVKAGEIGGVLDGVLLRLADFLERSQRVKGKVAAAMFYPAAVLTVATLILGAMMIFVVPRFREVFSDLLGAEAQMPVFTQWVLGLSTALAGHFLWFLAGTAIVFLALSGIVATRRGRRWFDRGRLSVPVLGTVVRKAAIARFSRTLGTLLNSGVPILQALSIVRETSGNTVVAEAVDRIHAAVKDGEGIARPMKTTRVFPATVIGMIDVGEQTGALPDMLTKVADVYDNEVDNAVTAATSLLEPLMIVLLALLVGSIVIALFLPLIDIITGMTSPAPSQP
jgi:type IV pilus assembly protein PilC